MLNGRHGWRPALFWHYLAPGPAWPDRSIVVVVGWWAMAVEMAMGLRRSRTADLPGPATWNMADMAADLKAMNRPGLGWAWAAASGCRWPGGAGPGHGRDAGQTGGGRLVAGTATGPRLTLALACAAGGAAADRVRAAARRGSPSTFRVDGLSAVMVVTVAVVTLAVLVFRGRGVSGPGRRTGAGSSG